MVVTTVTLNPAIDKTYFVDGFTANALNRASKTKKNVGCKGINVSTIAAICGTKSIATGFLSGSNGKYIDDFLTSVGAETDFVYTEGETRENIKIVDLENNTYTDVNESGPFISEEDLKNLYEKVDMLSKKSTIMHMGGSFHPSIDEDIYKKLIEISKANGAMTVLDAGGEPLNLGITALPDIIKPNQLELELMIGRKIKSVNEAGQAAMEIVESGVQTVLVSLGGNGAVAADKSGIYRAYPLHVPVKSTVGAGDSFLSGFLFGRIKKLGMEESLKYAISFASAKVGLEGTDMPDFKSFIQGYEGVVIEKI